MVNASKVRELRGAGAQGPTTVWIDVTPQQASEWLTRNRHNRRMSKSKIQKYAREMAAGAWTATHQGIAFAPDGRLLDGQHRLAAIIDSGVTVRMQVTFDLPADVFNRIDVGWNRSASQMAEMMGTPNARQATAVVRMLMRWDRDRLFGERTPTAEPSHRIAALACTSTPLGEEIQASIKSARSGLAGRAPVIQQFAFSCALHLIAARVDRVRADGFFHSLNTGANLSPRSPVLRLHERIFRGSELPSDQYARAIAIKAWNCHRDGGRMGQLKWPAGEEWPLPGYDEDIIAPLLDGGRDA